MKLRKWGAWLLVLAVVMQLFALPAAAAEEQNEGGGESPSVDLAPYIEGAVSFINKQEVLSDWAAIGLAQAGYDVRADYLAQVEAYLKEKDGKLPKVTDYERMALGVMAAGGDPARIGGYNLIDKIINDPELDRQGANGMIFALIVLDAGEYEVSDTAHWNRDKLIQWLVQAQNEDGGWSIVQGEESSVDITAMAVTALAPHQNRENVLEALYKSADYLSGIQLENGGFPGASAEAAAQVVIALTSAGVDPSDERFVKSGGSALTYLLSLAAEDGGFVHLPGDTESNVLATEQALLALAGVQRLNAGEEGVFRGLLTVNSDADGKPEVPEGNGTSDEPGANEASGAAGETDESGVTGGNGTGENAGEPAGEETGSPGEDGASGTADPAYASAVQVRVQVEGPSESIASGEVRAHTALEALERLLTDQSVSYETVSYSFGKGIDSVDGIASGSFGGWDGWMYAVLRGDRWIHPAVSLDAFTLEENDRVVLYYSDNTKVVKDVEPVPAEPEENEPFSIRVTTSEWDWTNNKEVVLPAAGVRVTVGGQSAVTDAEGLAQFDGLPAGEYEVVVDGYKEGAAPSVVKTTAKLTIAGSGAQ